MTASERPRFSRSSRPPAPGFVPLVEALLMKLAHHGYYALPIVDLGVLVASADGVVDENEMEFLDELFTAALGEQLPTRVVQHLVSASQDVIQVAGSAARLQLLAEIFEDAGAMEDALQVAFAVAHADGAAHEAEIAVIRSFAARGHVDAARTSVLAKEAQKLRMPELQSLRRIQSVPPKSP
jgi:tellurite resistance protein